MDVDDNNKIKGKPTSMKKSAIITDIGDIEVKKDKGDGDGREYYEDDSIAVLSYSPLYVAIQSGKYGIDGIKIGKEILSELNEVKIAKLIVQLRNYMEVFY